MKFLFSKRNIFAFVGVSLISLSAYGVFVFENEYIVYNGDSFFEKTNVIFSEKEELSKDSVSMLFFGDLMLDRDVKAKARQRGVGYFLEDLEERDFFEGYDIISANLEGTVTDGGGYFWPEKKFDFAFLPEDVLAFKEYGFNFFNVANNHSYDQGEQGVLETQKNLKSMGYNFSGCMAVFSEECSGTILDINGKTFAMLGFSVFGSYFDSEEAKAFILKLKEENDFVVVNIHWGEEYQVNFNDVQQEIAHGFVDAGADVVVGHHPHVVQGVEVYKNKPIFYSLGNFIFDQYFSDEVKTGLAASLLFNENEVSFELHLFYSDWIKLRLMEGAEKEEFLEKIKERSP